MRKIIDDFIEYESLRGIKNARDKASHLKSFFLYLDINKKSPEELSFKDAQDFQTYLTTLEDSKGGLHYATLTIRSIMTVVTRFYSFLKSTGKIFSNPFLNIKRIRIDKSLPKNLPTEKNMCEFLNYLSVFWKHKFLKEQRVYYKVHVMAELMYSTGMRIGEVLALTCEDIDFDNKTIKIQQGKGGKQRYAHLNDYALGVLKIYCEEMREVINVNKNTKTVFGIKNRSTVGSVFHRYLNIAGERFKITKFTSHGFRHSLGFHLLRRGCDMRYIQLILGHEDMNSTVIYTKVEKSDLKTELDNYHPRQFKGTKE